MTLPEHVPRFLRGLLDLDERWASYILRHRYHATGHRTGRYYRRGGDEFERARRVMETTVRLMAIEDHETGEVEEVKRWRNCKQSKNPLRVNVILDRDFWFKDCRVLADLLTDGNKSLLVRRVLEAEMERQVRKGSIAKVEE